MKYISFFLTSFCLISIWQVQTSTAALGQTVLVPEVPKMAPASSANAVGVQSDDSSQAASHAVSPHVAQLLQGLSGGRQNVGQVALSDPAASFASSFASTAQANSSSNIDPAQPTSGATNTSGDSSSDNLGPARRGKPAPLDSIFPSSDYIGIDHQLPIGVPDTGAIYPLEKMLWKNCPLLRKARIRIYGWGNPGWGYSSSKKSNIPNSYYIVPRRVELDQAILRIERVPDTVQTEHADWGFRITGMYGIDTRFTTAQGWYPTSREILLHNNEYAFDPVELYGNIYIPKILKGMNIKFGRFISPPDIEAQLAPDNFLWTHSQMFTVDCYTQTGFLASIKLNDDFTLQAGMHSGSDIASWDKAAIPTAEVLLRWTSKNNNDSIYGGVDAINNGNMRLTGELVKDEAIATAMNTIQSNINGTTPYGPPHLPVHDNLQQCNVTWSHRFNKKGTIVTMTEMYYLWSRNAVEGGTVNWGPPRTYSALTGPGAYLPGLSQAAGFVNYTAWKCSPRDYICIRPIDYLLDQRGWRTGFPTTYATWTIGWCHRFSDLLSIRPEIRYDRALSYNQGNIVTPYDNGTRRYQFTFGMDLIQRF